MCLNDKRIVARSGATPSFCPEGGAVSPQRHPNCSGTSLGLHRQVRIHRFRGFWTRYLLHRSKPTHIQQRYHSMTQASIRGTPASRNNRNRGHEGLSLYGVRHNLPSSGAPEGRSSRRGRYNAIIIPSRKPASHNSSHKLVLNQAPYWGDGGSNDRTRIQRAPSGPPISITKARPLPYVTLGGLSGCNVSDFCLDVSFPSLYPKCRTG
jgi:hypothetical protein